MNSWTSLLNFTPHHHPGCALNVLHYLDPSWFGHGFPSPCFHYPTVSLHQLFIVIRWYRNICLLCIAYAFRPQLSSRLTLGGRTFPRKPKTFDGGGSRPTLATHAGILSCMQSTTPYGIASARIHCSSTDRITSIPKLRCKVLAPVIFGALSLDQWAITHSLNEWLLLSQHPGCFSNNTSFTT